MDYHNIFIVTFYFFAIAGLLVKLVLNMLNIQHIASKSKNVPDAFAQKINLEDHQKAANYSVDKLKFSNISMIFHFALLMAWIPMGGLKILDDAVRRLESSEITTGLIFFGAFSLIGLIIDLPESLYRTFILEEKYGFNKTTKKTFVIDILKSTLISLLIGAPLLYILMALMQYLGNQWWLFAWGFMVVFQFFIIWAYPKFIAPLFNKFTKMQDQDLTEKLDSLIKDCELSFKDYYVMNASLRSSHGNAYFTGFGKNKRIVFFDTLLETLDNNEVIAVLAHELGHLKHKHILKSLIWGILFMGFGFFILGWLYQSEFFFSALADVRPSSYMGLMLFAFVTPIYTFLLTPISSWISRKKEYEADTFASTYAEGRDLISALIKMYKDNASTLTPSPIYSKFYYSHPPALERVQFINDLETKNI